jgi:hypothetical protein
MAKITGRIPDPEASRNRGRAERPDARVKLARYQRDGKTRGPVLPKDRKWSDRTKTWYRHWRQAPQAVDFEPQDWEALHRAALLHEILWGTASPLTASQTAALAKQIAAVESALGGTFEDRLRMRIHIVDEDDEPAKPVMRRPAVDYASRLGA